MTFFHKLASSENVGDDDIIHRAVRFQIGLLPFILLWVLALKTSFLIGWKTADLDLQTTFSAILYYEGGVIALCAGSTASLFFRKTANPDGSSSVTESIKTGRQPDQVNIDKTTTIIQ